MSIFGNVNLRSKEEEDNFDNNLFQAFKNGNNQEIMTLISENPSFINKQIRNHSNFYTPLMIAASTNNAEIVKFLLDNCADQSLKGRVQTDLGYDNNDLTEDKERIGMMTAEEMAKHAGYDDIVEIFETNPNMCQRITNNATNFLKSSLSGLKNKIFSPTDKVILPKRSGSPPNKDKYKVEGGKRRKTKKLRKPRKSNKNKNKKSKKSKTSKKSKRRN